MNKYLSQLKEFRKYGSWAIWDKNGKIEEAIKNKKNKLEPHIIFMGFNASYDLREAYDWANYHFIEEKKNSSWKKEHCKKLADVLQEDEFEMFKGAYMTDIIKSHYNSDSRKVDKTLKEDQKNGGDKIKENRDKIEREIELLSKISKNKKLLFICMGDFAFKWTKKMIEGDVYKIYHYSNWGKEKVRERIRHDLKKIIKNEIDFIKNCETTQLYEKYT